MFRVLSALLSIVLRFLGQPKSKAVQEGEQLGAAQANLATEEQANAQVQKASAARDAVAARDDRAGGLSDAMASDPDCRDCSASADRS